jgi:hypothetical protein
VGKAARRVDDPAPGSAPTSTPGEHPVSGQQGPRTLLEASGELFDEGRDLTIRGASLAERFAVCERKAALLEQIAAADSDDPAAGQTRARRRRRPSRTAGHREKPAPTIRAPHSGLRHIKGRKQT